MRHEWYQVANQLDTLSEDPCINRIAVRLRRGEIVWAHSLYLEAAPTIQDARLRQALEGIFGCPRHGVIRCEQCGLRVADNLLEMRRRLHLGPET